MPNKIKIRKYGMGFKDFATIFYWVIQMTEPEWDDEIYDELDLSLSTLKPGLVLSNGSQSLVENTTMTKRELWWGRGQMSGYSSRPETDPEFVVKFFSTDADVAKSYARCIPYSRWIHKFEVSVTQSQY